jgi:membrane protein implicated in regulation of membrane protease activity
MSMEWWVWLLLGLLLLFLELLTPGGFYIIFFGIGAVLIGILVALELAGPLGSQLVLFAIVSLVMLLVFRRPLLKRMQPTGQPHEVDSLIGETALALENIPAGQMGKVELRGASWNARNIGETPLKRDRRCKVERVEGLTLHIRGE